MIFWTVSKLHKIFHWCICHSCKPWHWYRFRIHRLYTIIKWFQGFREALNEYRIPTCYFSSNQSSPVRCLNGCGSVCGESIINSGWRDTSVSLLTTWMQLIYLHLIIPGGGCVNTIHLNDPITLEYIALKKVRFDYVISRTDFFQ